MSKSRENGSEVGTVDVVIVGAGFAGLSAADRIAERLSVEEGASV